MKKKHCIENIEDENIFIESSVFQLKIAFKFSNFISYEKKSVIFKYLLKKIKFLIKINLRFE